MAVGMQLAQCKMYQAKVIELTTILVLISLHGYTATAVEDKTNVLYVIPNPLSQTNCPTHYCYTLSELVNKDIIISSNTRVVFLPGEHTVTQNGSFLIQYIDNLEISGKIHSGVAQINNHTVGIEPDATAKIVCNNTLFGIILVSITNLTISNIDITGCGAAISSQVDLGYGLLGGPF